MSKWINNITGILITISFVLFSGSASLCQSSEVHRFDLDLSQEPEEFLFEVNGNLVNYAFNLSDTSLQIGQFDLSSTNSIWSKEITHTGIIDLHSLLYMDSSLYLVYDEAASSLHMSKFKQNGVLAWSKIVSPAASSIQKSKLESFYNQILFSITMQQFAGFGVVDTSGNVLWNFNLSLSAQPSSDSYHDHALLVNEDSTFYFTHRSSNGVWISKYDYNGSLVDEFTLTKATSKVGRVSKIVLDTISSAFYILSYLGDGELLHKTDLNGNVLWTERVHDSDGEITDNFVVKDNIIYLHHHNADDLKQYDLNGNAIVNHKLVPNNSNDWYYGLKQSRIANDKIYLSASILEGNNSQYDLVLLESDTTNHFCNYTIQTLIPYQFNYTGGVQFANSYFNAPINLNQHLLNITNGSTSLTRDDCNFVGVIEEIESELSIFPNPSAEYFNVSVDNAKSANVVVTDMRGKIVFKESLLNTPGVRIDHGLETGLYLVAIYDEENHRISSKKLVVVPS